jgi:hypothetical protein
MVSPAAIESFRKRQLALLSHTYDQAWSAGVDGYQPDDDPPVHAQLPPDDGHPAVVAAVGLGAAATLLAKRRRAYRAPVEPHAGRKARALAAATSSVDKMTAELATLAPSSADLAATDAAIARGELPAEDRARDALSRAIAAWADRSAGRLDAGASAAWAGEQDGYAQAANADGMLVEWVAESDERVCQDCEALAGLPPMPAEDWPSTPGDGSTECNVGCRCTLDDVDALPSDLTPAEHDVVGRIADRAGPTLPAFA